LADNRPTFYLAFGYEDNREDAAEDNTVDVTDMIGDNNVSTSFELAFIAGDGNSDIEDESEQQRVITIQTADNFPAVWQAKNRDPSMYDRDQGEKHRPERQESGEFKQAHR
jgi:hypothetical protein